jgi:hypothetical protein
MAGRFSKAIELCLNYNLYVAGPGGELVMNPIPGVAGVDYPTFNSVPDTGFDCEKQNFPGIYSDTGAQCQVIPHTNNNFL